MAFSKADLIEVERARGSQSLERYARMAWPVLVPDRLIWTWHMSALCEHLEALSSGEIRDLVVCVPPGTSKSLLASTIWPSWDWIKRPERRFLAACYAQDLSEKNARLHRDLVASEWYQERWPHVQIKDVTQVRHFANTALGWRQSTSVGGRATGIHADVQIGDDLSKAQDAQGRAIVDPQAIEKANDFWFKTFRTRRANAAELRRLMIAQRIHHDDTPGRCIEAGYTALVLPMEYAPDRHCSTSVLWNNPFSRKRERFSDPRTKKGALLCPQRFPREVVEADKSPQGLGPVTHEAQNNQNPTPPSGAMIKVEKALHWTELPERPTIIITVDCAFKSLKTSDFVAIQVWAQHGPNFYMLPWRFCDRTGITGTIEQILRAKEAYPQAAVYVEDKANGPAVIEILSGEVSGIVAWDPKTSKEGRAAAVAHLFEAGNVYLPPESLAPWIAEVKTTWARFPLIRHDDDVDAMTMALLILYQPSATGYAAMVDALKKGMPPGWRR